MTKIEWTDETWNPVVGCSVVSPGCANCYAMRMAGRIEAIAAANVKNPYTHYAGTTKRSKAGAVWTGKVALAPEHILTAPLRWNKPRRIFVNSMGDLFHEDVPDQWIDRVFAVMALAPRHTFQVLTKRAERMRMWFARERVRTAPVECLAELYVGIPEIAEKWPFDVERAKGVGLRGWPLPNVWLGVSVEDQARANERREDLKALAAMGWTTLVSYEPALGPVDWTGWEFLRWLISGGESGKDARASHPDWHRAARDFCARHGIAYFFKQWGEWIDADEWLDTIEAGPSRLMFDGQPWRPARPLNFADAEILARMTNRTKFESFSDGRTMIRTGKTAAGATLDGREHREVLI